MNIKSDKTARFILAVYGITLTILLVASIVIPRGIDVLTINGAHSNALDQVFKWITLVGDGKVLVPVIIVLLFVRFRFAAIACAAWLAHGLVCGMMKHVFFSDFKRPIALLDRTVLHFVPGVTVHTSHSFPSGHTATAFCLAILLSLLFRSRILTVFFIAIAVMVAYSRVYLLQHFLVDVAAGAFIGTTLSILAWSLFYRFDRRWMHGRLELHVKAGRPVLR